MKPTDRRLARGVEAHAQDRFDTRAPHHHPQQAILATQAKKHDKPLVYHVVITVEKTYSSIEPGIVPSLETTLNAMTKTLASDCPNYRFKEWTKHDESGLEFTLAAIIPPLPPSIVFGEIDPEDARITMIRCITAHQSWLQYGETSPLETYIIRSTVGGY